MRLSRRDFLAGCAALAAAVGRRPALSAAERQALGFPLGTREWHGESSVGASLRSGRIDPFLPTPDAAVSGFAAQSRPALNWHTIGPVLRRRFHDLPRHFIFEYYPWYGVDPWRHWDEAGRRPPDDIAATSVPRLGPYDSRSRAVVERHARWMAEAGVGAINLSWWGPDSWCDRVTPLVMDVMRDHDIHVTFHLEPYRDDRAAVYARDVLYLLREYGERRRWDALLLLENADGRHGPIFKSFRTILPPTVVDCHGVRHQVPDYTPDTEWRRQVELVRDTLRREFDHVTLLADSLDVGRMETAGFDGMAVYDNYVRPETWPLHAENARHRGQLFSFNVNPGFDGVVLRDVPPDSCYRPPRFEPPAEDLDWSRAAARERAARLGQLRIGDSLETTLALQTRTSAPNATRGFLAVYINSFNEWHEGHQFEPMKDYAELAPAERAFGYHNPPDGGNRLAFLGALIDRVVDADGGGRSREDGLPSLPRQSDAPVPGVTPVGR